MQQQREQSEARTVACVGPFALFLAFLALAEVLSGLGFVSSDADAAWYRRSPEQWIYPIQTVACLTAVVVWRKHYTFGPHRGWGLAIAAGVTGIVVWLTPGICHTVFQMSQGWWQYLGFAARRDGFNPFSVSGTADRTFVLIVVLRFVRLVIVVPLVEEIFWREFLMRWLADPNGDYWQVPFGTHHWRSLTGVTLMFVLAHGSVDYAAALVYGLLAYFVTVRTRSLSAVIIMHMVANLLLGVFVMTTRQWGYW